MRKVNKAAGLTPRAEEVLDYFMVKDVVTARDALLDLDINSGSLTRRITELRDAGYPIEGEFKVNPYTGRRFMAYTFNWSAYENKNKKLDNVFNNLLGFFDYLTLIQIGHPVRIISPFQP